MSNASEKTMNELVREMNANPVTLEQLTALEQDKTPAGREAYLQAAKKFVEHAGSTADKMLVALKREQEPQTVAAQIARQSETLDNVEANLEATLHHVRAANKALREATKRPWWMRFLCC